MKSVYDHERAFWAMVDSCPNCVNCGGKCHQSPNGREQRCFWCRSLLTRSGGPSRLRGLTVLTWHRAPMDSPDDGPKLVLEMR